MSDTFERKVLTSAQRAARDAFRQVEATKAMTEHEKTQKAFNTNRERLKAERLKREADASEKKPLENQHAGSLLDDGT